MNNKINEPENSDKLVISRLNMPKWMFLPDETDCLPPNWQEIMERAFPKLDDIQFIGTEEKDE